MIPEGIARRVAVVGTPRSGNTWLRTLTAKLLGVPTAAYHEPSDIPWSDLPPGYALQLHWHPTDEIVSKLTEDGFHLLSLARHPADILLSILQYAQRARETHRWLSGEGGDESTLQGATPVSEEFRAYCVSERARALLSLSPAWASTEGCHLVRYEDLVSDTSSAMEQVASVLHVRRTSRLEIAIGASKLPAMRAAHSTRTFHFWQGRSGSWRELIPRELASAIAEVHPTAMSLGGYELGAATVLTQQQVIERWRALEKRSSEAQVEALRRELQVANDRMAAYRQLLENVPHTPAAEYAARHGLGMRSVKIARLLKRLVDLVRLGRSDAGGA